MTSAPVPLHPVSYDDVATACSFLRDHGGDGAVTVRAVRQRLGRGSMDTLLRHVRRWKGEGGVAPQPQSALTPEDRERVLRFAEDWLGILTAREAAGRRAEIASAEGRAGVLESELAELSAEFERMEAELAQAHARLEALSGLDQQQAEWRAQAAALTAQAKMALTLAEADGVRSRAREEAALDEMDKARTQTMKAERRAEKLAEQVAGLQAEAEAAEIRHDARKGDLARAQERAIAAEARLKALEPLLSGLLQGRSAANRPQGDPANQP